MARVQSGFTASGVSDTAGKTLGTSSSGDLIVEMDASKFKNMTHLRDIFAKIMKELEGTSGLPK